MSPMSLLRTSGQKTAERALLVIADSHVLAQRLGESLDRQRLQDHLTIALERCQVQPLTAEDRSHRGLRVECAHAFDAVLHGVLERHDAARIDLDFPAELRRVEVDEVSCAGDEQSAGAGELLENEAL